MTKYRYRVTGVNSYGRSFESECIDNDIIKAIKQYRKINCSVHSITRLEQLSADAHIGIL